MVEILKTLRDTPLPSILVIGGLVFLLLPFLKKTGGAVEIETSNKGVAALIGVTLLIAGIGLYLFPTSAANTIVSATATVTQTQSFDLQQTATRFASPTSTVVPPTVTTLPTQVVPQPTIPPEPTKSLLIHGKPVSSESLARIVGGNPAYWKQAGPVVWVYSNKNNNTTIRHPGENMVLTYWAGFGDPQNASDCQIIISPVNKFEKAVKCPAGTNAQIVADQVGLHIIDYTGFFP